MTQAPAPRLRQLVDLVYALLKNCDDAHLQDLLGVWPDAGVEGRITAPCSLPVVRWVGDAVALADTAYGSLMRAFSDLLPDLMWSQTYNKTDFDAGFIDNYGFVELVGTRGPYPSDRIASGILMLGPQLEYPMHSHDAEEYYFPLTPGSSWKQDARPWFAAGPGEFIYNHRRLPHAIRTGAHPMMVVYLWHGERLAQKSRIH